MNQTLNEWAARHGISHDAFRELLTTLHPHTVELVEQPLSSEGSVQARLQVAAPQQGNSLWRNNAGAATTDDNRHIRFGVGNISEKLWDKWKSSDLIGITQITVGPRHLGSTLGVFTAVEVKKPGWKKPQNKREEAQMNFIANVNRMGGLGLFAQDVDDYNRAVNHKKRIGQ